MTIQKILRMGDPRLLEPSATVEEIPSAALDALITDLLETMEANHGAGLAAPQIGVPLRVVVFGVKDNSRYPDTDEVPFTILINPEIEPIGENFIESWEGCLSIPGMRGLVPRHEKIRYRGMNEKGQLIDRDVEGFHAIVVQHECDHLDGILYPMRMPDMGYFGFEEELSRSPQDENETEIEEL